MRWLFQCQQQHTGNQHFGDPLFTSFLINIGVYHQPAVDGQFASAAQAAGGGFRLPVPRYQAMPLRLYNFIAPGIAVYFIGGNAKACPFPALGGGMQQGRLVYTANKLNLVFQYIHNEFFLME